MNAATATRPEVAAFLDRVREGLADLTEEEREELLDGLEADLSEQVADGGAAALPDPVQYAAELRAAAGLGVAARRRWRVGVPTGRPASGDLSAKRLLDRGRTAWLSAADHDDLTRQGWALAVAMRPAWWALRAWVAVTLLDQALGPWEYVSLWPRLGAPALGPVVLLVAVVLSAMVGTGRLWPGSGPERSTVARVVLLALNALALLAPLTFSGDGSQQDAYVPSARAVPTHPNAAPVLRLGRDVVRNIYPYDADGRPLQGVQLFDQQGRPVQVAPQSSMGRGAQREVTCPWFNGTTVLFNVYPLQQRTQPFGSCLDDNAKAGDRAFTEAPLASVPPAALPAALPSGTTPES